MGGANLEVWKFGFYTLFPLATLYYFSDDDWYNQHVVPYGRKIWPEYEKTNRPPHTQQEIQAELARMKAQRQSLTPVDPASTNLSASTLSHEMRSAASTGIFSSSSTEQAAREHVEPEDKGERIGRPELVQGQGVRSYGSADRARLV